MNRRLGFLLSWGLLGWSAPLAAHFTITAPAEGETLARGSAVLVQIDVLVHHDPGETFDIAVIDDTGKRWELATGVDDTAFPYAVRLPMVDASSATLSMTQHGPEGYRYEQRIGIRLGETSEERDAAQLSVSVVSRSE